MKINVDAALAKSLGSVAAVAVARDFTGRFLEASAVVMEGSLARNNGGDSMQGGPGSC